MSDRRVRPIQSIDTGHDRTDRALKVIYDALALVGSNPMARANWFYDRQLPDGVLVLVPHGLGRRLLSFLHCDLRGASTTGRIERVTAGVDETKHLGVRATGHGATVTVTLAAW